MQSTVLSRKQTYFIIAVSGLILVFILAFVFFSRKNITQLAKPNTVLTPTLRSNQKIKSQKQPTPTPIPAPKLSFNTYDLKTTLPVLPAHLNTYVFKTNFSTNDVSQFASNFGLTTKLSSDDSRYISFSSNETNNRGELIFDRNTGAFLFTSYGVHLPQAITASSLQTAENYLRQLGVADPTVTCQQSYELQGLSQQIQVVCHRDWTKVGSPILNYPGVLNTPPDQSLSQLHLGRSDAFTPRDPQVSNVVNGDAGITSLTDFNTAVVTLEKQSNRILHIESNLRWLTSTRQIESTDILKPEEAWQQFQENRANLALPLPAGNGEVDWTKVYPNQQAHGKDARITDFIVIYPEAPAGLRQPLLSPYYLVRGISTLDSGYTTKFIQLIPALRNAPSFIASQPTHGEVAGARSSVSDKDDFGQKQGTWEYSETTTPTPTTPTTSKKDSVCVTPIHSQETTIDIPGIGPLVLARFSPQDQQQPHILFFKSAPFPPSETKKYLFAENGPVVEQYLNFIGKEIQSNPSLVSSSLSTMSNAYNLFATINKNHGFQACNSNLLFSTPPAPMTPECIDILAKTPNNYYNAEYMRTVSTGVAKKLVSLNQSASIQSLAQKPNIFPDEMLNNFLWIFINDTTTGIAKDFAKNQYCYVTGVSPSLFVYSDRSAPLTVTLHSPVTYNYPLFNTTHGWTFTANSQGTLSFSPPHYLLPTTNYLYYEYDPTHISFTQPHEGWIVKTDELQSWVQNTFAPLIGLNEQEARQMVNEVKHEAYNIEHKTRNTSTELSASTEHGTYIKVSLANQEELNQKLPLMISPQTAYFYRLHLLITPLNKNTEIQAPLIAPIKRNKNVIIEIGARLNN